MLPGNIKPYLTKFDSNIACYLVNKRKRRISLVYLKQAKSIDSIIARYRVAIINEVYFIKLRYNRWHVGQPNVINDA